MKKILLALALFFLMIGGFSDRAMAEHKGEFRIGNEGEPETLDPHLQNQKGLMEERIDLALFENLITLNPEDASPAPGLAESWEISADGKVYIFKLRKTAWSDGVPITAQTIVKSWLRVLDPKTSAPYAWSLAWLIAGGDDFNKGRAGSEAVKIKALDDYTFKMELARPPVPYALGLLTYPCYAPVPMHVIEKYGKKWTEPGNMVGNGPFILEEWKPNVKLSCIPNPQYWDKDKVKLARVIFYPIGDSQTAHKMFLNGELDYTPTIPLDQMETALKRPDSYVTPYLETYYYLFHCRKKPFNDPKVRKALSISINREWLVKDITKAGEIATNAFVPPIPGYKTITGNKEDIDLAKKLLAEAGFPDGKGFKEFKLMYNKDDIHKQIAEHIRQQWKENLGIECTLVDYDWHDYLAKRRSGDYEVARARWLGDYLDPTTFLDLFITNANQNDSRYGNKDFDQWMKKAAKEADPQKRMEFLSKAEEILITQDQAVMPIFYNVSKGMIDTKKWGGWYSNILDLHPIKSIFLQN